MPQSLKRIFSDSMIKIGYKGKYNTFVSNRRRYNREVMLIDRSDLGLSVIKDLKNYGKNWCTESISDLVPSLIEANLVIFVD